MSETSDRKASTHPYLLGEQIVEGLFKHRRWWLGWAVVGLLGGGVAGLLQPRGYRDEAVIEVGRGYPDAMVEHVAAATRRFSHLVRTSSAWQPHMRTEVRGRRAYKTNAPTPFIEVAVTAENPDAARAVLDEAIASLKRTHDDRREKRRSIYARQGQRLERLAEVLVAAYDRISALDPVRNELAIGLAETYQRLGGNRAVQAPVYVPPTRVSHRSSEPLRVRSRVSWYMLGGLLFGLTLAVGWILLQRLGGLGLDTAKQGDPVVVELVALSGRYRNLILCVVVVMVAMGAAIAVTRPPAFVAYLTVRPAEVEGTPVDSPRALAQRIEADLQDLMLGGQLSPKASFLVKPVIDQPPQTTQLNLIGMVVEGPDKMELQKTLEQLVHGLITRQTPVVNAERVRIDRSLGRLTESLDRLLDGPVGPGTADRANKLIKELAFVETRAGVAMTHPPEVLVGPTVEPRATGPRLAASMTGAGVAGLILGYLIAFLLAGFRAYRDRA